MPTKAKRSNHLNRLVCIITEDISKSEAHLIPYAHRVITQYRNEAKQPDLENLRDIVELLYRLCQAKKSRLGSHIESFYRQARNKQQFPERYPNGSESFEWMLRHCCEMPFDDRHKIMAHVVCKTNGKTKEEALAA